MGSIVGATGLIVLPPFPPSFDMMALLERGVTIKHDKKTDEWTIRVGKPD